MEAYIIFRQRQYCGLVHHSCTTLNSTIILQILSSFHLYPSSFILGAIWPMEEILIYLPRSTIDWNLVKKKKG